jgi:hypothetical protein
MSTPPIAHFGTTLVEAPPPPGIAQQDVPVTGALRDTLKFLEIFGFKPLLTNYYENMGRQYIWARGDREDVDYIEKDTFTSYSAEPRPATAGPRVGDTLFRLTHAEPTRVLEALLQQGLVTMDDPAAGEAFIAGRQPWLLIHGPEGQQYELGWTQANRADNHVIYVWTEDARLAAAGQAYREHFGLVPQGEPEGFHGIGRVTRLRRENPGLTVGLLHASRIPLAPRWSDDIFREAGYSHFRLGALDKTATEAATRQAFPAGGDVAYVYFEDSYLELVQA